MRGTVLSSVTLLILCLSVIALSIYTSTTLTSFKDRISQYPFESRGYDEIRADVEKMKAEFFEDEPLLRLIISDTALLEVDYLYSDVIEYARAENREGVLSSAGRLSVSLEHLINLSSLNLISIF